MMISALVYLFHWSSKVKAEHHDHHHQQQEPQQLALMAT
jgi:hypothetical protein